MQICAIVPETYPIVLCIISPLVICYPYAYTFVFLWRKLWRQKPTCGLGNVDVNCINRCRLVFQVVYFERGCMKGLYCLDSNFCIAQWASASMV